MKNILIQEKLSELDISLSDLNLGEFDYIGEYCAKKMRDKNDPLFSQVGAFFRPNYERGVLIYSLIKKYRLSSYLEIGFGRGFSAICAAKAMHDAGIAGSVYTVDVKFDEKQMELIKQTIPGDWLTRIVAVQGPSQHVLPQVFEKMPKFDFVYIDGDHRAEAVKSDWDSVKDKWESFCLFDDYHLPTKSETDIECAKVIDAIDAEQFDAKKELILLDRRIFSDDRRIADADLDYGQCLFSKKVQVSTLNEW